VQRCVTFSFPPSGTVVTRQHPWFRTHLPPYLRLSPAEHDALREKALDMDALALIASVGYPEVDTSDAALRIIQTEDHPLSRELKVVYELAVDEARRQKRAKGAVVAWCVGGTALVAG
jgi:hypothetical protein